MTFTWPLYNLYILISDWLYKLASTSLTWLRPPHDLFVQTDHPPLWPLLSIWPFLCTLGLYMTYIFRMIIHPFDVTILTSMWTLNNLYFQIYHLPCPSLPWPLFDLYISDWPFTLFVTTLTSMWPLYFRLTIHPVRHYLDLYVTSMFQTNHSPCPSLPWPICDLYVTSMFQTDHSPCASLPWPSSGHQEWQWGI